MASELLMLMCSAPPKLNVWVWGNNFYGVCGQNTEGNTYNASLTKIASPVTVYLPESSSAYGGQSGYISSAGNLFTWGNNANNTLGISTDTYPRSSPTQIGSDTTWTQLAFGSTGTFSGSYIENYYTVARKTDGTIWVWGAGDTGNLGLGDTLPRSSPVQLGALTTWTTIAASSYGSAYAIKGGTLWAWGLNDSGQLGKTNIISSSSPVQVGALTTWSKVFAGNGFAAGITNTNTLWLWGYNGYGNLGDNSKIDRSSPVQIAGGGTWSTVNIQQGTVSFGIKTNGTLWIWGADFYTSPPSTIYRSSPVQIGTGTTWSKIFACYNTATVVLLKTDGTVWLLGYGMPAPGITPAFDSYSSPVQIGSATNWTNGYMTYAYGGQYGYNQTLFLTNSLFELYSVGGNQNSGILGQNRVVFNNYSSPIQLGGANAFIYANAYEASSIFIKKDRTLWGVGEDYYTYIGPASVYRSSPIQIGSSSNWTKASVTKYNAFAINTSNQLYFIGQNTNGEAGFGNTTSVTTLTQVSGSWISATCNGSTSLFIRKSGDSSTVGTAWGCGYNNYGNLGQNNRITQSSPVQIGSGNYKKVAIDGQVSMLLKETGELELCGFNFYGAVGDNTTSNRSSPVQISGKTFSDIANGGGHCLAVSTDGTLWAWGLNDYGQLGNNSIISRSSPIQVGSDATWTKVFATTSSSVAAKSDGTLWGWGGGTLNINGVYQTVSSPVQIASNFKPIGGGINSSFSMNLYTKI